MSSHKVEILLYNRNKRGTSKIEIKEEIIVAVKFLNIVNILNIFEILPECHLITILCPRLCAHCAA